MTELLSDLYLFDININRAIFIHRKYRKRCINDLQIIIYIYSLSLRSIIAKRNSVSFNYACYLCTRLCGTKCNLSKRIRGIFFSSLLFSSKHFETFCRCVSSIRIESENERGSIEVRWRKEGWTEIIGGTNR